MHDRYLRQRILPEVGEKGQKALENASVLMVGCGGLASPVLMYLAGAGVGRIGIVDGDLIDPGNLHRQILFREHQTGKPKVEAAKENLLELNSGIRIETHPFFLDETNARNLARDHDVLIDGTDHYEAKALLNRIAIELGKPVVFSGVTAWDAQWFVHPGKADSPCYQCLYPEAPAPLVQNCEEAGVLGPMVGIAGSIQALQAIQLILNGPERVPSLFSMDGRDLALIRRRIQRNPECPACGSGTKEIRTSRPPLPLATVLEAPGLFALLDAREESETAEFPVPGAISLPLSRIEAAHASHETIDLRGLARGLTPVFFCKSGMRAGKAASFFQNQTSGPVHFLSIRVEELRRHP
jgi:molybdopterin/thiamine biosynthesis adenylyltransferase/rhodanese-related sulfurtransferase